MRLEYEREAKYNRENRARENGLQDEMDRMRALLDRNSYVTALIDGDNLTFTKDLLSKGQKGGEEAAYALATAVNSFAAESLPHMSTVTIHVKLYANIKALTEKLVYYQFVDKSTVLEDFLRGLVNSDSLLLDVVDTSLTKGLTTKMIQQSYRQDFTNVHCHQILLAALPNEELNTLLDELPEVPVHERVTFLEAQSLTLSEKFSHEIPSISFGSLLVKAPTEASMRPAHTKVATPVLARVESNSSSKTMNTTANTSTGSTPIFTWAAMTAAPYVPKPGSDQSCSSTPALTKTQPVLKSLPVITKNKYGQRVDAVDTSIPYQELQRIKKMKLCNIFYLQGKDACSGSCGHSHTYPLKQQEKNILKEVARMTPCYYKLECEDAGCIYGHRCPQSKPGKKDCFYKEACRFSGWGHGIDEVVVKITSIKG